MLKVFVFLALVALASSGTYKHTATGVLHEENSGEWAEIPAGARRLTAFSTADIAAMLDDHNVYRTTTAQGNTGSQPAAANMEQMIWDPALAQVASDYASQCLWQHNGQASSEYSAIAGRLSSTNTVGENLYMRFRSSSDPTKAVTPTFNLTTMQDGLTAWYDEHSSYDFNTDNCSDVCGHYTQMVWDTSRYVGCGYALCATATGSSSNYYGAQLLVCNYSPQGNYPRQPYTTGTACSGCPSGLPGCMNAQCAPTTAPTTATTQQPTQLSVPTHTPTHVPTELSLPTPAPSPPPNNAPACTGLTGTRTSYLQMLSPIPTENDIVQAVYRHLPCVKTATTNFVQLYPGFECCYLQFQVVYECDSATWNLGSDNFRNGIEGELLANGFALQGSALGIGTPSSSSSIVGNNSESASGSTSGPSTVNQTGVIVAAVGGGLCLTLLLAGVIYMSRKRSSAELETDLDDLHT